MISGADEILKYKNLLDQGIITQDEFEMKKRQLLESSFQATERVVVAFKEILGDDDDSDDVEDTRGKPLDFN